LKRAFDANFSPPATPASIFKQILERELEEMFSNLIIALRIFLTLPVSVADAERSFSLQKRVKNFLRSTMAQERLNGLAILSINCDLSRKLNYSVLIEEFASKKSRRHLFK
jgi:hypothetical protein